MFAESCDVSQVVVALSSRYAVIAEPSTSAHWTSLDTADWRLHRAGLALRDRRQGRVSELLLTAADGERLEAPARIAAWPRRIDTLSSGPLRDRLAPVIGVRALLPRAEVNTRSTPLRVLDGEGKTRTRVRIDQQQLVGTRRASLPLRVVVSALRGYERDADRCSALLAAAMPQLVSDLTGDLNPVAVALRIAGHTPGDGAPRPTLDPDAPVIRSLARVLLSYADTMDAARGGVLDDIDPEFLHDLRTALRATRSILSSAGDLLPGGAGPRFAPDFAWLGRITSPLRDLDVYALELAGHGNVDVHDLTELLPLRKHVLSRRRAEFRTLRAGLLSSRGARLSDAWRATLEPMLQAPGPLPATADTASRLTLQAYHRVAKSARAVTSLTPAEDLHALRRRAKRLRYLIDAFESLSTPDARRTVLADVKKLQDCLGDIQDSDVQTRYLSAAAQQLAKRGVSIEALLTMGALRDRVARRDTEARRDLGPRLDRLSQDRLKTAMHTLYQATPLTSP